MEEKEEVKQKLVLTINLTLKEYDLIMDIRKKLRFGRGVLVTHDGQPIRVEEWKPTVYFGRKKE